MGRLVEHVWSLLLGLGVIFFYTQNNWVSQRELIMFSLKFGTPGREEAHLLLGDRLRITMQVSAANVDR